MKTRTFQLSEPTRLRAKATGNLGWVAGLDECVADLERRWGIRVGESLPGGSESLVATAVCSDGTPAILKVGLPGTADLANEAKVFRIADGRGYARLIAQDDARNALACHGSPGAAGNQAVSSPQRSPIAGCVGCSIS